MNANLIKLIAAIIMVTLTITISTIETIGAIVAGLYILTMLLCLAVIGVRFEITKDKPKDWEEDS